MRGQKGISLVEVMATVTVLAIAILAITFALQKGVWASKDNEDLERSVMIARTVLEEIKHNLKSGGSISVYSQPIDLDMLKNQLPPYTASELYYPSAANKEFRIEIQSLPFNQTYQIKDENYDVEEYFRLIKVTCIKISNNRQYELEAYIEYN